MRYLVATERLGWPPPRRGLTRFLPWEVQTRHQYDCQPERPTATCHLQTASDSPALCGHPWECLIEIPGAPAWTDLHSDLRCDSCEEDAGWQREDSIGRTYRFTYDLPSSYS